jgi:hypothetical protein
MRFAARCTLVLGYAITAVALGSVVASGSASSDGGASVAAERQVAGARASYIRVVEPAATEPCPTRVEPGRS